MSVTFDTLAYYITRPDELVDWIDTLSMDDLKKVTEFQRTHADLLREVLETHVADQGPGFLDEGIAVLQSSITEDKVAIIELNEEFFGNDLDCTEANDFINRVKKESL